MGEGKVVPGTSVIFGVDVERRMEGHKIGLEGNAMRTRLGIICGNGVPCTWHVVAEASPYLYL